MDGKFPSWTANGKHSHGVADNTPWGYQALDNVNISSHCGKVITEENYDERWDGDFPNVCPQSLQCKVSVKDYANSMNTEHDKLWVLYFSFKTTNIV